MRIFKKDLVGANIQYKYNEGDQESVKEGEIVDKIQIYTGKDIIETCYVVVDKENNLGLVNPTRLLKLL